MRIDIVTLFPKIALAPLNESIPKRAQAAGIVQIHAHDLRQWARGKHRKTDDYLCGGGQGMLLKPEPLFAAVEQLRREDTHVVLATPQGKPFRQAQARCLSTQPHLLFLCGHYEGVDQRVVDELVDEEISLGDYVLTNGALASAVICDAVVRLLPGALGDERSPADESFCNPNLLEAPAYTKPVQFRGLKVPPVLLSGNHGEIRKWKEARALERTRENRPDLLGPEARAETP
ncbi:MAG: tRNA (guanosine(37)-N1)-methyltransferase TrmD [Verrucomicrobiaceae bacterium]|nr:tRNA (guanosine(37)-N1)-methyltransferase TrmD [Verrucomicrobiaceae bacterium]